MPLTAGTRIGSYDIVALIGAGGMGEVYRARDARLGRDVAIKIVSPSIAADADGLRRFEREARMLASLNHPNIAAIYGVEDHGDQPALILELVDGETLADRVARGRVPIEEALGYARQIADALDTAHEAGIVHRDLKPGNIKIAANGTVKVLDFGLAKAIAAAAAPEPAIDPAQSPTVTVRGTLGGIILGTAAYMSPEQARGKAIDKRTDVWAFGCVLYEMLAGTRPFNGETTSDVIAAIIERSPDWSKLPASTPAHVRRVVARCLEKDPKRRARDIADVTAELDVPPAPAARAVRRAVPWLFASIIAVLFVLGGAFLAWRASGPTPPLRPAEFTFAAPAGTLAVQPAMPSPDGTQLAFVVRDPNGRDSIWLRSLAASTAIEVEGSDGVSGRVFWSPDGRSLGFVAAGAMKRVPLDGGPVVTLTSVGANLGASWGAGDVILFAPVNRGPLMRIPATGGTPVPVTRLDPTKENSHRWPHFLPDGRHFLFTVRSDRPENQGIKVGSLDTPEIRPLLDVASPAAYVEPGWLVYQTPDLVLMAQPFDAAALTLTGPPRAIAADVRYNGPSAEGFFSASRDGSVLTYVSGQRGGAMLTWFDRAGRKLGVAGPERPYGSVRLSPDARRAAVVLADARYSNRDVWVVDTETHVLTRVTSNPATDWRPVWSPDGSEMVFASDRMGLSTVFRMPAASPGAETIFHRGSGGAFPYDWSRDGKQLVIMFDDAEGRPTQVALVSADGRGATPLISDTSARSSFGRFSPGGDYMSFQSDATGNFAIYVMSLADRRRIQVSTAGGVNAMWGANGREIVYVSPAGDVMSATITTGATLSASPPARLFSPCADEAGFRFAANVTEWMIDVTRDGDRFLAICTSADAIPSAHVVAVNWLARLR